MELTYDKQRELGKGFNSFVYLGKFNGTPVAVKRIETARLGGLDQREESAMRTLDHPNVLKLFHVTDETDFRLFVLELCDGTLADMSKEIFQGRMPSDLDALKQMANGIAYIHSKNYVHRDIKPENILIKMNEGAAASLKISDFGFCKPVNLSGKFSISGIKGTDTFMAPELLELSEQSDLSQIKGWISVDIFSLGCVFYFYMTSGKHPFGTVRFVVPSNIIAGNYNLDGVVCLLFMSLGVKDWFWLTKTRSTLDQRRVVYY